MAEDFSSMSDAELQRLYWSMTLDTHDDFVRNDRIADELSRRQIGVEQAIKDAGGQA